MSARFDIRALMNKPAMPGTRSAGDPSTEPSDSPLDDYAEAATSPGEEDEGGEEQDPQLMAIGKIHTLLDDIESRMLRPPEEEEEPPGEGEGGL